jgi:hypothetical protein
MAELLAKPEQYATESPSPKDREDILATNNFLEGLITDDDAANSPANALTTATNVAYTRKLLLRRNGLTLYSLTKPNSQAVIKIFAFYQEGTGINILRLTSNTVHRAGSAGWTNIPASGIAAFAGTNNDPFSITIGDNRCFVSNNGVDPIREIDTTIPQYQALGNAPKYKHITTAFNRIIGAALVDTVDIPYKIGWSGDLNYDEWDTTVDPSAGYTLLVDSPSDVNDDITGLFTTANILVVPRLRSCWIGVGQPSATAPFAFYSALPTTGADVPRTIVQTNYGLCWLNYLERSVYVWAPSNSSNQATVISGKIARALKQDITDPNYVWASYSLDIKTYFIYIANSTTSAVIEWAYNFEYGTWSKSEFTSVWSVSNLEFSSSSISIDELTGTIDALVGTIDSLAGLVSISTKFYGFTDGEIRYQNAYYGTIAEAANIVTTDDGTAFTSTIAYKILEAPVDYLFSNFVRAVITPMSIGTVNLQYSKDDGTTWTTAKSVTYVAADLNKANYLQLKKAIRVKRIVWRITTADCMCINNGFYVKALHGGIAK